MHDLWLDRVCDALRTNYTLQEVCFDTYQPEIRCGCVREEDCSCTNASSYEPRIVPLQRQVEHRNSTLAPYADLLDVCIAFSALRLPPYVMLWITERLPGMTNVSERARLHLIESVARSKSMLPSPIFEMFVFQNCPSDAAIVVSARVPIWMPKPSYSLLITKHGMIVGSVVDDDGLTSSDSDRNILPRMTSSDIPPASSVSSTATSTPTSSKTKKKVRVRVRVRRTNDERDSN
jgi:hypothetical protein